MCTASNRLRGDTTTRVVALTPDVVAFADVTTNRANAAQSLVSAVVRDTDIDVALSAIESHTGVDNVDDNDYDYADVHVPRYFPHHYPSHYSNII